MTPLGSEGGLQLTSITVLLTILKVTSLGGLGATNLYSLIIMHLYLYVCRNIKQLLVLYIIYTNSCSNYIHILYIPVASVEIWRILD